MGCFLYLVVNMFSCPKMSDLLYRFVMHDYCPPTLMMTLLIAQ